MSKIQSIKNVTAYQLLELTTGKWFQSLTGLPTPHPDEMIIRQITYNGDFPTSINKVYFIWSNIVNDYIGHFTPSACLNSAGVTVSGSFVSNPQTRFIINQPIPSQVEFQIHEMNGSGVLVVDVEPLGEIAIALEFVKFSS